jgi:hypothetical protein
LPPDVDLQAKQGYSADFPDDHLPEARVKNGRLRAAILFSSVAAMKIRNRKRWACSLQQKLIAGAQDVRAGGDCAVEVDEQIVLVP